MHEKTVGVSLVSVILLTELLYLSTLSVSYDTLYEADAVWKLCKADDFFPLSANVCLQEAKPIIDPALFVSLIGFSHIWSLRSSHVLFVDIPTSGKLSQMSLVRALLLKLF